MPEMNVLVCGATGQQGGAVARALLARGHHVTALTRDPSSPAARAIEDAGAALAGGDMTDPADCARVLEGMDAAFLMATPYEQGPEIEVQQGTTFAQAAASAGIGHLVYSSVAGSRDGTGLPHFDSKLAIERRIEDLGVPYTLVAPVYLFENVFMPGSMAALREGALAVPLSPDTRLQQIAVADIGGFVAVALENRERFAGRRLEIAGDELTGADAARILGEVMGRDVRYMQVPLDAVRQQGEALAAMFQWMDGVGFSADVEGLRRDFPEVGWRDFGAWAREQELPSPP